MYVYACMCMCVYEGICACVFVRAVFMHMFVSTYVQYSRHLFNIQHMHIHYLLLMWWLHRHPEGLESDLRAKIGQNGISSGVGRQDLKFLVCYLSEGRNLLLNTRHRSAQVPRPYGTVQNGRETFPEWPTRGWLVCRSQAPHKLVVCHSGTRMSLGMDVSQSQVTLEIDQEWQLLSSHTGGT